MSYGISREEEYNLPQFKSHEEARIFFKEKYGDDFQMTDSSEIDGEKIYFYKLILNREAFEELHNQLREKGCAKMTKEMMFSSQDIQIFESGHIHIVH